MEDYFGGKEGVGKGLYRHILNEMDELIDEVMGLIESPAEQCKEIIKHTETHRNIIAFMFHTKHSDFLPNEPLIFNSIPFVKIRAIIDKGIKREEFINADTWIVTSHIFGATTKMIQLRLDGNIDKALPEYYERFIDSIWAGVKFRVTD